MDTPQRDLAEWLHDGPVQTLTAVSLRLGLLRTHAGPTLEAQITELERLVGEAMVSIRHVMMTLAMGDTAG